MVKGILRPGGSPPLEAAFRWEDVPSEKASLLRREVYHDIPKTVYMGVVYGTGIHEIMDIVSIASSGGVRPLLEHSPE